ncbi:MAG: carbohydrate ABC transporter permease [Cyanobacteria bacterium HKST-UBA05]|nr:carbohydrate ABC transporter permease [Cyanobacteria bacterium HKST-UBA05]
MTAPTTPALSPKTQVPAQIHLGTLVRQAAVYTLLALLALASVGPFLWLVSTALKSPDANIFAFPPELVPTRPTLQNFAAVWQAVPLGLYFANSVLVTGSAVIFNLIFSTLAAYPLARFEFAGKNQVFMAILATMMIPFQVIMIPLYMIMLHLNLVDSASAIGGYLGLIIPFVVSGFGIFFVRQAMVQIPRDLEQSVVLDGCNSWQVLTQIYVPLIKPTLATLAVFTFIANWGEFLWPSIVLSKQTMYTLPVGLVHLQGAFSANWRLIAAGTVLAALPVIVFFFVLQRYFMSGTLSGSLKG